MSSLRTQTIEALQQLIADCRKAIDGGIEVNGLIHRMRLPVPPLDLTVIYESQRIAESVLAEIELKAMVRRAA